MGEPGVHQMPDSMFGASSIKIYIAPVLFDFRVNKLFRIVWVTISQKIPAGGRIARHSIAFAGATIRQVYPIGVLFQW